jgi:hypothetical protein
MEQLFISSFVTYFGNLRLDNPALLDLLKMVMGTTLWIGSLIGFLYLRERKLKAAVSK